MADCCESNVEQRHNEPSASASDFAIAMATFGKSLAAASSPVAIFYPHLALYDFDPVKFSHKLLHAKLQADLFATNINVNAMSFSFINPLHKELINVSTKQTQEHLSRRSNHCPSFMKLVSNGKKGSQDFSHEDDEARDYSTKCRKAFFCHACSKSFKFQTSLLRHNNKVHISKYQCQTCRRVFSRQAYLDVHTSKQGSSCYLAANSVMLTATIPKETETDQFPSK